MSPRPRESYRAARRNLAKRMSVMWNKAQVGAIRNNERHVGPRMEAGKALRLYEPKRKWPDG
jgi:hypothetical protein